MKTMYRPDYHHNSIMATHVLRHIIYGFEDVNVHINIYH